MSRGTGNAAERDESRRCRGKNDDNTRCKKWAMPESTVCKQHEDQVPQDVLKATGDRYIARERKLRNRAQRVLDRIQHGQIDRKPVENPLIELASLAGDARWLKEILRLRVEELEQADWTYMDRAGVEQAAQDLILYGEAIDRLSNVLEKIAKLNIDERLARIDEMQGAMVINVLNRVFERMDLGERTDEAREFFYQEVTRQHEITGGVHSGD